MGFSVNATVAGFSTNSYVTVAEADAFMNLRYNTSAWSGLTTNDKEAVLVQAARDIGIGNFIGERYYETQSMPFPRDGHTVVEGNCASVASDRFKHSDLRSDTYGEIPTNYWKYGSIHFTSATLENEVCLIASSDTNGFVYANFSATPTTTTQFIVFSPIEKNIKDAQCEQAHYLLTYGLEQYAEMRALGIEEVRIGDFTVRPKGRLEKQGMTPVMCIRARKLMSRYFYKGSKVGRA